MADQITLTICPMTNGEEELRTENDVLRLVCAHSKFVMAELWSFGNGSTGLDASVFAQRKLCPDMRYGTPLPYACMPDPI